MAIFFCVFYFFLEAIGHKKKKKSSKNSLRHLTGSEGHEGVGSGAMQLRRGTQGGPRTLAEGC